MENEDPVPEWFAQALRDEIGVLSYEWDNGEQHSTEGYVKDRIRFCNETLLKIGREPVSVSLRGEKGPYTGVEWLNSIN